MSKNLERTKLLIQLDSNVPLTRAAWYKIHKEVASAIEERIMESGKLTEQLGHVLIDSEYGQIDEICV